MKLGSLILVYDHSASQAAPMQASQAIGFHDRRATPTFSPGLEPDMGDVCSGLGLATVDLLESMTAGFVDTWPGIIAMSSCRQTDPRIELSV